MILTLSISGVVKGHEFPKDFLNFCYKEINCDIITKVRLTKTVDMWLDDNGMYTQILNYPARKLANIYGYPANVLFGNCVITGTTWTDDGPDAGDLTEEELYDVINKLNGVLNA